MAEPKKSEARYRQGNPGKRRNGYDRNSQYNYDVPELLVEYAEIHPMGSITQFCKRIGIGRTTFYAWMKANPDLQHAHDYAMTLFEAGYEEEGQTALVERDRFFNVPLYSLFMKNKFSWRTTDPKDTAEQEQGPTKIELAETTPVKDADEPV